MARKLSTRNKRKSPSQMKPLVELRYFQDKYGVFWINTGGAYTRYYWIPTKYKTLSDLKIAYRKAVKNSFKIHFINSSKGFNNKPLIWG